MVKKGRVNISAIVLFLFAIGSWSIARTQTKPIEPQQVQNLLAKSLPQTLVGECIGDESANPLIFDNITVRSTKNGDITVQGLDREGSAWTAHLEIAPAAECQVWTAGLTNQQHPDLMILVTGLNSSGGWDSDLYVLTFDAIDRPFPWRATGNFSSDLNGIRQVVREANTNAARIIVPQREGDRASGMSFVYYVFGISNSRISSITNTADGSRWPLVLSSREDFIREAQSYSQPGVKDNISSDASATQKATIVAINNPQSIQDEQLVLSNNSTVSYPSILMVDKAEGARVITFDPAPVEIEKLSREKAGVRVMETTCNQGDCQPLLLRASE